MAVCDTNRPLTQAEREAGYDQQRTGVPRALRPFSGSPTIENLIDYVNRELGPCLRAVRSAANDVWKQVVDNAPSANPLAYYFSDTTTNADPTNGRIRLDAATQNTATTIRVSENNARLQTVQPWLDVMSGGPTTPLGTVTLVDAINPGRFLRFDLNTMTDRGAYWDLGVTIIESSDTNPFCDGEAVTLGFIAGVSAAGSTVPVGSLSPVARDTFLGNIGTTTAAPSAVPLASIDSTSIIYDATAHEMQRAALTGFAASTQNSNATTSAEPIVSWQASSNMSNERTLTTSTSNTIAFQLGTQVIVQRAALTGDVTASLDSNATTIANDAVTDAKLRNSGALSVIGRSANTSGDPADISAVAASGAVLRESGSTLGFGTIATAGLANDAVDNTKLANMSSPSLKGRTTAASGDPEDLTLVNSTSVSWNTATGGSISTERAALTGDVTASANSNATTIANSAVTNAKMANITPPKLKGRTTSGAGAPEDLTLANSTSVTWNTATGGSISVERAALTGEVTASANANATTVTRSTDFQASPWTGNHEFDAQVRFGTITTVASTGSINITLGATSTRVNLSSAGTITVGTCSGCAEGRLLLVEFSNTGEHTITHDSTSADAFACPGNVDLVINGRGGFIAIGRLGTNLNWKILAVSNDLTTHANTWTATNTFSGTLSHGAKVLFAGIISPTALSADQNDYNPTGWSTANVVRLSTNSGTARTITGAVAGTSGELKWLVNLGPGFIQFDAASTASTAANRFLFSSSTTFTISVNGVCGIIYDGTSSRWRAMHPTVLI